MNSVVMPIQNTSSTSLSLWLTPSEFFAEPAAPWLSPQAFDEHLLELSRIPVGADRSSSDALEAERLYALASPTKHWLALPVPHPNREPLSDRLSDIADLVGKGRLAVEHARRLLVPDEPSWLHDLNTEVHIKTAHILLQDIARAFRGECASDTGRALFRGLLEIEGESPSRVLLNMNLFHKHQSLSPIDLKKFELASRVCTLMDWMEFTPAEITRAAAVPRKQMSQHSQSSTQPA
jgi:hypothetical protein